MKRFIRVYGSGSGSVRHPVIITFRDGAVHKIFVCKLHRTAQFHLHTTLLHKKFVNLLQRTAKVKNVMVTILLNTNTVSYCMRNYKPNRLVPHSPPDASQTIALDNHLV